MNTPPLSVRLEGVGVAIAVAAAFAFLGVRLGRLRGPRPPNVVRYNDELFAFAGVSVGFAVDICIGQSFAPSLFEKGLPAALVSFFVLGAAFFLVLAIRYVVVLTPERIVEKRVFRNGWRVVEWGAVLSWKLGRKPGSIILTLATGRLFELAPVFKEGINDFYDAINSRAIPEEGAN
jgi:hypothetical protein